MNDSEKLAAFEKAMADLKSDYQTTTAQLDDLRAQGAQKKATYQQLTARKLTLRSMISYFEDRGLI